MSRRGLALSALLIAPLVTASSSPPKPDSPRSVTVAGRAMSLEESAGKCLLRWQGQQGVGTLDLDMATPCQFHRDLKGALRVRTIKGARHFLVEHATRASGSADCVTLIRAVSLSGTAVRRSPHMSRVASCPPAQWDAMMFSALFE